MFQNYFKILFFSPVPPSSCHLKYPPDGPKWELFVFKEIRDIFLIPLYCTVQRGDPDSKNHTVLEICRHTLQSGYFLLESLCTVYSKYILSTVMMSNYTFYIMYNFVAKL